MPGRRVRAAMAAAGTTGSMAFGAETRNIPTSSGESPLDDEDASRKPNIYRTPQGTAVAQQDRDMPRLRIIVGQRTDVLSLRGPFGASDIGDPVLASPVNVRTARQTDDAIVTFLWP